MKKYLLFASAILAFASCANDSYLGTEDEKHIANGERPITFGFDMQRATRAEDLAAATLLNRQFVVYAEKNEGTDGAAPGDGNLVFQNYKVYYTETTANTTTSNTDDWEYVGLSWTANESGNITTSTTDVQTIKFWDDAASSYTFTAVSAKPADIEAGRVKISKITSKSGGNQYDKGYTITLTKTDGTTPVYPSLGDLYFADRNNIEKGSGYAHSAVKLNFRNSQSQVRVGIYETIPGYKVSEIHFFKQDGTTEYNDGAAATPTNAFGAVCNNISATNFEGTLTVTYGNGTNAALNQPIVSVTTPSTPATDLVLGTNYSTLTTTGTAKFLGETATTATYDTDGGTYTLVMPQEGNTTNLKLKVNYTLYNEITHEKITITGKTAEIPGKYLAWKPNFKYTYLFKLTDDDLNPITFDAAVIEAADGTAEYITTVTEPSITTFGVKDSKYSVDKDEYETGSDIYATIVAGGNVITPVTTGASPNVKVYKATTTDAANFPITEASIAEAIANPTGNVISFTDVSTDASTNFTAAPAPVTTVPAEDGSTITIDALKLTGVKNAGNYVIEYNDGTAKHYKVIKVVAAP